MSRKTSLLTADERQMLERSVLVRHQLEEQFENLEQQHRASLTAMWVFLATEVMFFGALFLGLGAYHLMYPEEFEKASAKLNWVIGGVNTIVLLVSSLMIALAVHFAKTGNRKLVVRYLALTAALGMLFLVLKGCEYYIDYQENLIPGWRFDPQEWTGKQGLSADQVPHVELFLMFYWIMTPIHGLHVIIGIVAVLIMMGLAQKSHFSPIYYSPVEMLGLYWHFVDIVWIFLLPLLYLLGTHAAVPVGF
jgi:cytochrome c oxidase subunit 3